MAAMGNNTLLEELRELARSDDLPQKVSNRLLLAGIIKNTNSVDTLIENSTKNDKKIAVLEKATAFLSALVLTLLGWTVFA